MHQVDILKLSTLSLVEKLKIIQFGFDNALAIFEQHKSINPKAKMLFIMPENTFSARGELSHYSVQDAAFIFNYFLNLSQKYTDVIILPGSIKRYKQSTSENDAEAISATKLTGQWFHEVLDLHGKTLTPSFNERMSRLSIKNERRLLLQNTAFLACNGKIVFIDKKVPYKELVTDREKRDGVFQFGVTENEVNIEGLNFGVEICCDNDFGLLASHASLPIDVHILISATIPTFTDAIACHKDGLYIHCDASPSENSIVIKFEDGKGIELKPALKAQEYGLMAFEVDLTELKYQEKKTALTNIEREDITFFKRKSIKY
tara:strand:- start:47693 stop:48646 length:954 start_codon:yes stop_codon:yes gene_type:complete